MRQLVSQYVLEKYLTGEERGSLPAAAVFVDLSGFSVMTAELARHGDHGAEVLADVMRAVFEPLVGAVYGQGGFVAGYAGDAFTGIFCEHSRHGTLARRALASAVAMQEHIRSNPRIITEFGEFPISIKAGIGAGEVNWLFLKSATGDRATYCLRGSSVDGAVSAEECAPSGGIVLDQASRDMLKATVTTSALGACHLLHGVNTKLPKAGKFPAPEAPLEQMAAFLPEAVLGQALMGEFRQVVNVFIDIPLDPAEEAFVAPFMESIFSLQERYGGFFLRPDMGDKGFNILIFWGAPTAHENDIDRALNFVLDLKECTQLAFKAGITYQMAYTGFMGAAPREDYTAYGWGVNLASRMMEAAPDGEVWMDAEAGSRAQRHFQTREVGVFSFKGTAEKARVFSLEGRRRLIEIAYRGEFVGREAELGALTRFLKPLQAGEYAGLMLVEGEAGIGKSRLVHSLQLSPLFQEMPTNWVVCQSDEMLHESFNPFKDWLRQVFEISEEQGEAANLRNFERRLKSLAESIDDTELSAELGRTSSVLAALLDLEQPSSFYEQLDAKGRHDNTMIALSVVLRVFSCLKPLVLLIEDLHWLDDDSCEFLPYFIRTLQNKPNRRYPIAILVTSRPDGQLPGLDMTSKFQRLPLERLASSSVLLLAQDFLQAKVNPGLHKLLEERSEGNPFFAGQLLRYFAENRLLVRLPDGSFDVAQREAAIPMDVRSVLVARLDRLSREVRAVVQTAAVLGREFEIRLLSSMLDGDPKLREKIGRAEDAAIWFPLSEEEYIFQHTLLRDAAYSMQLVGRLRRLHAMALRAIEALHAGDLSAHLAELAHHAERASLAATAREYLVEAGTQAAASYQNSQAIGYFSRALSLIPSADLATRFEVLRKRVEIQARLGDRKSQLEDLDRLEDLAGQIGALEPLARLQMLRSSYHFAVGEYPQAASLARQAVDTAGSCSKFDVALESHSILAVALSRQSQLNAAIESAKEGLALAQSLGRRAQEGAILNSLGMIAVDARDSVGAQDYLERALLIARELQHADLEAKVSNNLGNVAGSLRGDFSSARDYYEHALAIVHEWGDRYAEGLLVCNLAWVTGMQGDLEAARAYHGKSLALAREVGNLFQEAYTLINLSAVASIQGDSATASDSSLKAYEIARRIGDQRAESFSLLNLGHAMLQVEEFEQARDAYGRCIELAERLEQPGFEIEPMAGLVQVALQLDDIEEAAGWTEQILRRLEGDGALEGTEEPLRVYYACYEALLKMKDPRASSLLQEAKILLDAQVSKFPDEPGRRVFVNSAPWRQAIRSAWEGTN